MVSPYAVGSGVGVAVGRAAGMGVAASGTVAVAVAAGVAVAVGRAAGMGRCRFTVRLCLSQAMREHVLDSGLTPCSDEVVVLASVPFEGRGSGSSEHPVSRMARTAMPQHQTND